MKVVVHAVRMLAALFMIDERRLEGGRNQELQVPPAHIGRGVFRGNHLALFRDTDLPAHRARRMRENRFIARASSASH